MYSITNNTKITIRNTRTTQAITILKTDLTAEDRVTGKVVAGIPFIDTIDDSLDSFVVQLKDYPQRDLFKPFDFVVFTVNDGLETLEKKYFVLFDDVKTYSQMRGTYVHNLSLIEPTKILEKIKIFNLNLTNQSNSFMEQVERALVNAEPIFYNLTNDGTKLYSRVRRLLATSDFWAFIGNKASRDFYFSNTDLRSVLDEMLGAYNARVTVEDIAYESFTGNIRYISLGYRDMTQITSVTPTWTKEEQGELIFEHAQNDGQNHAGTILSRGYNSIAEEPVSFTDMLKSDNMNVTDTSACAMFPFPISSKGIKHFYINTTVKIADKSNPLLEIHKTVPAAVDIAPYIIRSEEYDLLKKSEQRNVIPFDSMSQKISMGKTYQSVSGAVVIVIKEIIKNAAPNFVPEGWELLSVDTDYLDLTFTCVYYPIIDTVASISKPNVYDNDDLQMGIMDFQTEQTLDIDRHGKKLAGLIKRTGNAEYYLDVKAKYYSKLLPLMSKIDLPDADSEEERGFVLYRREYAIYDNFINCRYYFSKDFNAVQQNAGVNRTKHIYDIPLESDEVPIMVKKYLVLSKIREAGGGGFDTSLPVAALNTLIGKNESTSYTVGETTKTAGGKLKYMLFQSQATKNYPQNTENSAGECEYTDLAYRFARPICAYALNKTMTFTANCLDNYSVDYSRDGYRFSIWGAAGNMVTYNRYVDNDAGTIGEAHRFELDFAFEWKYSGEERTADATTSVANFPVAKNTDFVTCGLTSAPLTVEYYKDRTQTPLFVFALECIPCKSDYGEIIIGTEFAKKNNLVRDNGAGLTGLNLYTSQTLTFSGEENLLSDEYKQNSEQHDVGSFFVVEAYSYGGGSGAVLCNTTAKTCLSWAIADEQGNILLAVNGSVCDIYAGISNFPYVKQ